MHYCARIYRKKNTLATISAFAFKAILKESLLHGKSHIFQMREKYPYIFNAIYNE